jgi:transposase
VLGGLQVDQCGHLTNWVIPNKMVLGMGGAMDLASGAKRVVVAMQHTAKGVSKVVKKCTLPITSLRQVDLVVTELAAIHTGRGSRLWEKMYLHFQLRREDFLAHYHKRSNVESTFSMIKAKFRDHVRSKTPVAMVNEVLCKIICHNICVLIQEAHELGIEVKFQGK